ncbi:4-alpha-glucanotransferase (amylomaltase) [Castellaniella defragrans 65Phen]|uniref:4-alpha-glucanotransferase n=1 Tax=Castellaniella defragrans (strain DSM 12143 / CCUG 39792 / 65Phen) TaxID=1437824 RepID=W8WY97_CASD6|nr:4-alpha-glucanotransferase [Castellaniella defragrans]CDM24703.1 4-alpha-glucanotransferase (amylomaltase) [Castellaniella defragrans 65Phen]
MSRHAGGPGGAAGDGLSALAARAGLQECWTDAAGAARRVSPDTLRALLRSMGLPCATAADIRDSRAAVEAPAIPGLPALRVGRAGGRLFLPGLPPGDCLLEAEGGGAPPHAVRLAGGPSGAWLRAPLQPGYYRLLPRGGEPVRLAIAPRGADTVAGRMIGRGDRLWGAMAQIYSLRSAGGDPLASTWGYGDFGAVRRLAQQLAREGADALMLSPAHAMFSADPAACSPYGPSNRLFLNAAYAAPADVLGEDAVRAAMRSLGPVDWAALDAPDRIDWPRAAAVRMRLLRRLHAALPRLGEGVRRDYRCFVAGEGQPLKDHAVFECLQADPAIAADERGRPLPWTRWGACWRDARAPGVRAYARAHAREVDFHCFLQWLAAASLRGAHHAARGAGMRIGLMADLAVGTSPAGSQAWSQAGHLLEGVSIGAPPDLYSPLGQNWHLTAFSPHALRAGAQEPFLAVLRAGLAHVGGLRIDHVAGFERIWVIPEGAGAAEGAYLRMPARELLALTALEAWRRQALVVGENLGTVPAGLDAALERNGILGMDVLWFMRQPAPRRAPAPFLPASHWPPAAAAMATTHDLPTLAGWWQGVDIDQREQARLLGPGETASALRLRRAQERAQLWTCVAGPGAAAAPPRRAPIAAMLGFVAAAPCPLVLTTLEDLAGVLEAPNVPGTVDEFPNWRRRLPEDAARACVSPAWRERLDAIRRARGPGRAPTPT